MLRLSFDSAGEGRSDHARTQSTPAPAERTQDELTVVHGPADRTDHASHR